MTVARGLSSGVSWWRSRWAGAMAQGVGKFAYGAGKAGYHGAGGMAQWAMRKPSHAIGLAGVGAGLYGASAAVGTGESGMDAAEASAIMQQHGGPSTGFAPGMGAMKRQSDRSMFMESTFGLTQGLHRGRHR